MKNLRKVCSRFLLTFNFQQHYFCTNPPINQTRKRARINQRLQNIFDALFMSIIIEAEAEAFTRPPNRSHATCYCKTCKTHFSLHTRSDKKQFTCARGERENNMINFTMVSLDRKNDFNKNILIREISAYTAVKNEKSTPATTHA